MEAYAKLKEELCNDPIVGKPPSFAKEWFAEVGCHADRSYHGNSATYGLMQVLDYNVPGGKLNRGMAVYDVLVALQQVSADIKHGTYACADAVACCRTYPQRISSRPMLWDGASNG